LRRRADPTAIKLCVQYKSSAPLKDRILSSDEAYFDSHKSFRQRLLEAGAELLSQQGEMAGIVAKAASQIGCSPEVATRFFECDSDLVHAIYARITYELEERIDELCSGSYGTRFAGWIKEKFAPEGNSDAWIQSLYQLHLTMMFAWCLTDSNIPLGDAQQKSRMIFEFGKKGVSLLEEPSQLGPLVESIIARRTDQGSTDHGKTRSAH
jgi:hypothetical protein